MPPPTTSAALREALIAGRVALEDARGDCKRFAQLLEGMKRTLGAIASADQALEEVRFHPDRAHRFHEIARVSDAATWSRTPMDGVKQSLETLHAGVERLLEGPTSVQTARRTLEQLVPGGDGQRFGTAFGEQLGALAQAEDHLARARSAIAGVQAWLPERIPHGGAGEALAALSAVAPHAPRELWDEALAPTVFDAVGVTAADADAYRFPGGTSGAGHVAPGGWLGAIGRWLNGGGSGGGQGGAPPGGAPFAEAPAPPLSGIGAAGDAGHVTLLRAEPLLVLVARVLGFVHEYEEAERRGVDPANRVADGVIGAACATVGGTPDMVVNLYDALIPVVDRATGGGGNTPAATGDWRGVADTAALGTIALVPRSVLTPVSHALAEVSPSRLTAHLGTLGMDAVFGVAHLAAGERAQYDQLVKGVTGGHYGPAVQRGFEILGAVRQQVAGTPAERVFHRLPWAGLVGYVAQALADAEPQAPVDPNKLHEVAPSAPPAGGEVAASPAFRLDPSLPPFLGFDSRAGAQQPPAGDATPTAPSPQAAPAPQAPSLSSAAAISRPTDNVSMPDGTTAQGTEAPLLSSAEPPRRLVEQEALANDGGGNAGDALSAPSLSSSQPPAVPAQASGSASEASGAESDTPDAVEQEERQAPAETADGA